MCLWICVVIWCNGSQYPTRSSVTKPNPSWKPKQPLEALNKVKELWKHGTSRLWLGVRSQTQLLNTANSWWNRPSILYWWWVNHMIFEIKVWKIVPCKEPVIWLYDFPYYWEYRSQSKVRSSETDKNGNLHLVKNLIPTFNSITSVLLWLNKRSIL